MARPLARRLARRLGRSARVPLAYPPVNELWGSSYVLRQLELGDPDQIGQDSDAKEDSIHNAFEHNRGMVHRNSSRRSTAHLSTRFTRIDTLSIAFARCPI
eukprot:152693-Pyramimonas_sp.AAC.1